MACLYGLSKQQCMHLHCALQWAWHSRLCCLAWSLCRPPQADFFILILTSNSAPVRLSGFSGIEEPVREGTRTWNQVWLEGCLLLCQPRNPASPTATLIPALCPVCDTVLYMRMSAHSPIIPWDRCYFDHHFRDLETSFKKIHMGCRPSCSKWLSRPLELWVCPWFCCLSTPPPPPPSRWALGQSGKKLCPEAVRWAWVWGCLIIHLHPLLPTPPTTLAPL